MRQRWSEGQTRSAAVSSAAISVLAHAAIVAFAVIETARVPDEEEELHRFAIVRFLAPPNRAAGQEFQPEMIRFVSIAVPEGLLRAPVVPVSEVPAPAVALGADLFDAPETPELPGVDSVFSIVDVDSAASRYEWSAAPAFPPSLLEARIPGYVKAQWVVNEFGYADTTSLIVLEATHPEFGKAVSDALPYMRFRPAKIGASAVRQRVEQEFYFRVTAPADTTRGAPAAA
ncbi:MAG: hypothetical protein WD801_06195 [Gemmatimonadaceae bacterium]